MLRAKSPIQYSASSNLRQRRLTSMVRLKGRLLPNNVGLSGLRMNNRIMYY